MQSLIARVPFTWLTAFLWLSRAVALVACCGVASAVDCPDPRLSLDLPPQVRQLYTNPDGSCVQCSIGMCGADQNVPGASTLLWPSDYGPAERKGATPARVAGYARSRGIKCWNITGKDTLAWMTWAAATGRPAAIGAGSQHFQTLAGHDPSTGTWWVCNNNSTQRIDQYTHEQFLRLHAASGPWCVVLDAPAHPARPAYRRWWDDALAQLDADQGGEELAAADTRGELLAAPLPSFPPIYQQVDAAAVRRLGDMTQRIDPCEVGDKAKDWAVEVLGQAPANDAEKWYVFIVSMRNCPACVKLKSDWKSDPYLKAIALPDDAAQSWSHFNVYDKDDASQSWRWEAISIAAYPTIIVQPPRTRRWGDPRTVVYQGVYHGDPKATGIAINDAIRRYVETFQPDRRGELPGAAPCPAPGPKPPFNPPPKDPPAPDLLPIRPLPDGLPQIPPPARIIPQLSIPWGTILSAVVGLACVGSFLVALVVGLFIASRHAIKRLSPPVSASNPRPAKRRK